MDNDKKVEYVLTNVFKKINGKSQKYIKRLRTRIRKSLQKEFLNRDKPVKEKEELRFLDELVDHFITKFFKQNSELQSGKSKPSTPEKEQEGSSSSSSCNDTSNLYQDPRLDSDPIEESPLFPERKHEDPSFRSSCPYTRSYQVHPISSEKIKHRDSSQKYHEIHLVRQINCLQEMVSLLRNTVQKKDSKIQLERQKKRKIIADNRLLLYRSKELTRIKIMPYVSPRSVMLVDTAVYSDFFGFIDNMILETAFNLVEIKDFQFKYCTKFRHGMFRDVYTYYLKSGETVILKKVNNTNLKFSEEQCLSVLSVEARISILLSRHENIVDCHGVFQHMSTYIVQSLEPKYLLKDFFYDRIRFDLFKLSSILRGVVAAVTFMHEKGILNNNIRHDNIALRCTSFSVTPVLLSLSLACRANSSKQLTATQQLRHESSLHLPPRVRKGLEPPSFTSDRYAIGFIMGNIIGVMEQMKETGNGELVTLHRRCFRMDTQISIEYFNRMITEICDEMLS